MYYHHKMSILAIAAFSFDTKLKLNSNLTCLYHCMLGLIQRHSRAESYHSKTPLGPFKCQSSRNTPSNFPLKHSNTALRF